MSIFQISLLFIFVLLLARSVYLYNQNLYKNTIGYLFLAAFAVRLVVADLDMYLHDWDERFHALVAKNLMNDPLRPLLYASPVLDYDYKNWAGNHIWLHKQPLFLWQMALSMKLFGVNVLAMRLPSVLMSALLIFPIFSIGRWVFNAQVGYIAALLFGVAGYQMELMSGVVGMDHNDTAFLFYVTYSIWAFYAYIHSDYKWRWALLAGVLAGCAILCKWLTGILVFSGWGLWLLANPATRTNWRAWLQILTAAMAMVAVALPWQIYTHLAFPTEAQYELAFNSRHIWESVEGHGGEWYFYFAHCAKQYDLIPALLAFVGLVGLLSKISLTRLPIATYIVLIYGFFSFVAATKVPPYVYVVAPLMYILIAAVLYRLFRNLLQFKYGNWLRGGILLIMVIFTFRPQELYKVHLKEGYGSFSYTNNKWAKINNTKIYKRLEELVPPDYVVFNTREFEHIDIMFFTKLTAYHWCMNESEYHQLKAKGIKIAAFEPRPDYPLPSYLANDSSVLVIREWLQ